jgi:hypothetical protein
VSDPMYQTRDDWEGDQHRSNPRVHYRLYVAPDGAPAVICVQDFDYFDYDARRMLSPDAWDTESGAERALTELIPAIAIVSGALPATLDPGLRSRMLAAAVRDLARPYGVDEGIAP